MCLCALRVSVFKDPTFESRAVLEFARQHTVRVCKHHVHVGTFGKLPAVGNEVNDGRRTLDDRFLLALCGHDKVYGDTAWTFAVAHKVCPLEQSHALG